MKKIFTISVICILSMIGCEKKDNPTEPDDKAADTIMPLKVGNFWNFVDSTFADDGTFLSEDYSKLSISGKELINYNGKQIEMFYWNWYDMDEYIPRDAKWLVTNESNGLNFYGGKYLNANFVFTKTLSIKFPVAAGEIWQKINYSYSSEEQSFYISDTSDITCVSVNQNFQTGSGKFSCYVYHYKSNSFYGPSDTYVYYAVNIGYVGLITKYNNTIIYKKTMTGYSLQKSNSKNFVSKNPKNNQDYFNEFQ